MRLYMRILYQVGWVLLLLAAAPFWLARRGGRRNLGVVAARLRLGRPAPGDSARAGSAVSSPADPARPGAPLWLHAVSVGEVGVAGHLCRALSPRAAPVPPPPPP